MVIHIDPRVGSIELASYLPGQLTRLVNLPYADVAFEGNGEGGIPEFIGVERKSIRDLLNSMVSGRLSGHQIPGITRTYTQPYLLVEGVWRSDPKTGIIQLPFRGGWQDLTAGTRRFMSSEVWNYLNTVDVICGVRVRFTHSISETAQWIMATYRWWAKDFDHHSSHMAIKHNNIPGTVLHPPSLVCRVAAELPGIGARRAREVAKSFKTVRNMVTAPVEAWESIPGISTITACKVDRALDGVEK